MAVEPGVAQEAIQLSALTRSDVLFTGPDGTPGAYSGRAEPAMGLFGLLSTLPESDAVEELTWEGERYFVVTATLPGGASVTFVRALSEELAIVPALRSASPMTPRNASPSSRRKDRWCSLRSKSRSGSRRFTATRIRWSCARSTCGRRPVACSPRRRCPRAFFSCREAAMIPADEARVKRLPPPYAPALRDFQPSGHPARCTQPGRTC